MNPITGESSALIAPTVNTGTMNAHLRFISEQVGPDRHVVLVLDRAGWHVSQSLKVPDNITLLHLPPYSPELNCIERLWLYLRDHYLGNRIFADGDVLWDACLEAWNRLEPQRMVSVCHTAWVTRGLK